MVMADAKEGYLIWDRYIHWIDESLLIFQTKSVILLLVILSATAGTTRMEDPTAENGSVYQSALELNDTSSDDQTKTPVISEEGDSAGIANEMNDAAPDTKKINDEAPPKSTALLPSESYEDIAPVQYPTIRRKDGKASKFHVYCTGCKGEDKNGVYFIHPLLHLPICSRCNRDYHSGTFELDEEGLNEIFCRWCGQGEGDLLACDTCPKSFCSRCLGKEEVEEGLSAPSWSCLVCDPTKLHAVCERNHWLSWKITALRTFRTLPRIHRMPPRSSKLKAREVVSEALGLRQHSTRKRTSKAQTVQRYRSPGARSASLKSNTGNGVVDERPGRYRCFSTNNKQKLFVFPVPPPTKTEPPPERPKRNLRKRKNPTEEKPLVVPYNLNVAEARSLPGRLLYCTACKCPASASAATKYFVHPLLHVPVCITCHRQYMLGEFVVEDGNEWFCRWCGQGQGALFLCDTCPKSFCSRCLGANEIQRIRSLQSGATSSANATQAKGMYSCYCCDPSSFDRVCDKNAYWQLWRDTGRRLWDAAHAAQLQRQELNATDDDGADDGAASETMDLESEDTSWSPSSVEGSRSGDSYRPSSYKAAALTSTHKRSSGRHRSKRSRPSAMSLLPDHVLIAHAAAENAPAGQAHETADDGREDRFLAADAPAWTHFLIQHRQHPVANTNNGSNLQAAMPLAAAAVFHDAADADDDDSSLHSLSSGRASPVEIDPQRLPMHQLIPRPPLPPPATALSLSSSSSSPPPSEIAAEVDEAAEAAPAAVAAASVAMEEISAAVTVAPVEAESTIVDDEVVFEETPAVEASSIVVPSSPAVVDNAQSTAEDTNKPMGSPDEPSALVVISMVSPPEHEETSVVVAVESAESAPGGSLTI